MYVINNINNFKTLIFILSISLLYNCSKEKINETTEIDNTSDVSIKRVIDGDTVKDKNEISYRLIGINCPERGKMGFDEAKLELAKLIANCDSQSTFEENINMLVTMDGVNNPIVIQGHITEKDYYGRELAYFSCGDNLINEQMISNGYAISYREYPHLKTDLYNQLEEEAKENDLGLWPIWEKYGYNQEIND